MHMSADIQINTSIWIVWFINTLLLLFKLLNLHSKISLLSTGNALIKVEKDSGRQRCNEIKADENSNLARSGRVLRKRKTRKGVCDWEQHRWPMSTLNLSWFLRPSYRYKEPHLVGQLNFDLFKVGGGEEKCYSKCIWWCHHMTLVLAHVIKQLIIYK